MVTVYLKFANDRKIVISLQLSKYYYYLADVLHRCVSCRAAANKPRKVS
jgi:hypothetical protein